MEEIWKDINGYEGYYQVSNFGEVKSVLRTVSKNNGRKQTMPNKIMSKSCKQGVYPAVCLFKNNLANRYRIHRLVAIHFIPNPLQLPQVNHKDGNKNNPHVSNLEWCTISQNSIHAVKNGLLKMPNIDGENNGKSKLTISQVLEIRSLKGIERAVEIALTYGVSESTIFDIQSRRTWTHI